MRRRFKLLAVLAVVPAALVVVAAIVPGMLADSIHYRREVIALVKEHTGHDLRIDGDVRLRVLPRLRLTVTDIRIANPPGFSTPDLARLPWLAVEVKLLPLLAGRIEPRAIDMTGLSVRLERDQQGRANWEYTTSAEHDSAAKQRLVTTIPLAAVAVGELNIREATLHWRDRANDEMFILSAINLETGAVHGEGIDDVRLQLGLPDSDATLEARGDARLSTTGDTLVMPKLTATFRGLTVAGMQVDGTLGTRLTAAFAEQRLALDGVRISASGSASAGQQFALEIAADLGFDLARQQLVGSAVSAKVPAYSLSGIDGDLALKGTLSGNLRAGTYTFEDMQGSGTVAGEAMADASAAFTFGGTLNADLDKWQFAAPGLEIAGSVDGDRVPFRLGADLDISPRRQTLAVTAMRLSIDDWRFDGAMTLRGAGSPLAVQGVLDLRVQDQPIAGSFSIAESDAGAAGVDVRFDVVTDLDIEDGGYALRGRNAIVLRAKVDPGSADGSWHIDGMDVGARLSDPSFPDGELTITLQADLAVNLNDETVHSDNVRLAFDDTRIVGSVNVQRFDQPALRIDLQADTIDADRYLLPGAARAGGAAAAASLGASMDAIRAFDFAGELRVQKLTLRGVQLNDVRLTSGGGG